MAGQAVVVEAEGREVGEAAKKRWDGSGEVVPIKEKEAEFG